MDPIPSRDKIPDLDDGLVAFSLELPCNPLGPRSVDTAVADEEVSPTHAPPPTRRSTLDSQRWDGGSSPNACGEAHSTAATEGKATQVPGRQPRQWPRPRRPRTPADPTPCLGSS